MNRGITFAVGITFLACSASGSDSASPPPDDTAHPTPPSTATTPPSSSPPSPPTESPCGGVTETCSAWNERATCVAVDGVRTWKKEACADGCFAGKCSATACADECAPGEAGCKLWDMTSKAYVDVDPTASLHDRARDYDARLRATNLAHDQVVNVNYTDESRTTVASYTGYRDAAIWTGSALAAEAWRLMATRSPDASARVDAIVRTLHRNFLVAGDPGYMARFVVPKSGPALTLVGPTPACGSNDWHCAVSVSGQTYDWVGGTSRDQYTGVMLGYVMAYLASDNEETRTIIRGDVVTIATELAKQRKNVPFRITYNDIPLEKAIDLENVILAPSELVDGHVTVEISSGAIGDSEMTGLREFFPDYSMLTKPALGIGLPIPRTSSAIMISAMFEAAILMSGDSSEPAMKTAHQDLTAYYDAHKSSWLAIAKGWTFSTADNCGKSYYSTHIAYIMAYVWATLVNDPALTSDVRDTLFDQAMWNGVKGHKNPYFAFLWGGTRGGSADKAPIDAAVTQLGQFTPGPRVHVPRDVTAAPEYMPHDAKCTAKAQCEQTNAVDVKDRVVDDFLWQRQPWQLVDGGDLKQVYPGVDYLAAYWAARRHGFVEDDRPGTCARKAQ
jgi:hypothetical protein